MKRLRQRDDADCIGNVVERKSLGSRIHDKTLLRIEIGARRMKSTFDPRCRTAFDLDGPQLSAGKREDEINLGPIGGSVVVRLSPVWGRGDQGFDDKAFPGLSDDWMAEQRFFVANSEQRIPKLVARLSPTLGWSFRLGAAPAGLRPESGEAGDSGGR